MDDTPAVNPKIHTFILDDHALVRRGVTDLLESTDDIERRISPTPHDRTTASSGQSRASATFKAPVAAASPNVS